MMLPILISVSVAPTSYFFCARAPVLEAASIARAAEKAPNRNWIAGIWNSLMWLNASFLSEALFGPWRHSIPSQGNHQQKAPRRGSRRGGYLVERSELTDP